MHRLMTGHWSLANRLLWYLCGTLSRGLLLCRDSAICLHASSYTDWVDYPDDRTSTSAYVSFLGSKVIS